MLTASTPLKTVPDQDGDLFWPVNHKYSCCIQGQPLNPEDRRQRREETGQREERRKWRSSYRDNAGSGSR